MGVQKRAELIIQGIVQGVGFRYFVYKYAIQLGLQGWVKNLFDGSVQLMVEGDDGAIGQLHNILKVGPMRSRVDKVIINYEEFKNEFNNFEIR